MLRYVLALLLTAAGYSAQSDRLSLLTTAFSPWDCPAAAIAPDGAHLAYAFKEGINVGIDVVDLISSADKVRFTISVDQNLKILADNPSLSSRITDLRWINPRRLLIQLDGSEMYAADADGAHLLHLINPKNSPWRSPEGSFSRRTEVIGFDPTAPDVALVMAYGPAREGDEILKEEALLFRIDTKSGTINRVWREVYLGYLICDAQGNPRIKFTYGENANRISIRDAATGMWKPFVNGPTDSANGDWSLSLENYFGHGAIPLGFGDDPQLLYFASNAGRDTVGIYALDLRTGKQSSFSLENPRFDLAILGNAPADSVLIHDRASHRVLGAYIYGVKLGTEWVDSELAEIQHRLDGTYAQSNVQILDWDDHRQRFLVRLSTHSDAGDFAVFDRSANKLTRYAARKARPAGFSGVRTTPWSTDLPWGSLSGYLTLPATPAATPLPVIVYDPTFHWTRQSSEYSPDVVALALSGYAVLEVNHRGVVGVGLNHWLAGRDKIDETPISDTISALDYCGPRAGLDLGKVAFVGERFGGYLAVRAAQLHPDRFHCAVVINAPVDLAYWLKPRASRWPELDFSRHANQRYYGTDLKMLDRLSPMTEPGKIGRPIFLITDPGETSPFYPSMKQLRSALRSAHKEPEYIELEQPLAKAGAQETAKIYASIEDFIAKSFATEGATSKP